MDKTIDIDGLIDIFKPENLYDLAEKVFVNRENILITLCEYKELKEGKERRLETVAMCEQLRAENERLRGENSTLDKIILMALERMETSYSDESDTRRITFMDLNDVRNAREQALQQSEVKDGS